MASERETMRAEFEAWATPMCYPLARDRLGSYADMATDCAWAAWVCSRRALSAEAKDAARKTWLSMDTVPGDRMVLLLVSGGGENRAFVAEQSLDSRAGSWHWMVTVGWTGWSKLRAGWEPIGWLPVTTDLAQMPDAEVARG